METAGRSVLGSRQIAAAAGHEARNLDVAYDVCTTPMGSSSFEQALQVIYSRVPTRLPARLRRVVVGHRGRGLRPSLGVTSSVGGFTGTVPERVQFS